MKSFLSARMYAWVYRFALNIWPCIAGSGGKVVALSEDFTKLRVKLSLNWRSRNRVGTIFGGSIYSSTDPFYMLMLMEILGRDYVVWDKGATIRFKRPAKETLFIDFLITPQMLEEVRTKVAQDQEGNFIWTIFFRSKDGVVFAEIDKVLYVAKREFYVEKSRKRAILSGLPPVSTGV